MQLDETSDIHPRYQTHRIIAQRDLPVGSLLCGTELSSFERGSAALFHHSPNVVRAIPDTPLSNPHLRGYYSWNPIDLLSYRLEGLVFPSALLATKTLRWCVSPATRLYPNIVLHFLGNGLNCGEVIAPILAGEELRRHWNLGPYAWSKEEITRGWIDQTPITQARILVDHL